MVRLGRLTAIIACTMVLASCAYYNTFYNARKSFDEAVSLARLNPDTPSSREEVLLDAAIEGAGKVLTFHPDSRWADDAQLLIADALLMLGTRSVTGSGTSDLQESMMAFASVLLMTEDPDIADRARLGMGRAAMELHRYPDAAASLEVVSDRNRSQYVVSRLLMSESLLQGGDPGKALAVLDTLGDAGNDSLRAEALLGRGRILLVMGEADSAAVACLRAGEEFGRGDGYYRALIAAAEAWIEAGRPEEAAGILDRLLRGYRSDLETATISLLTGKAHMTAGSTDEALAAFRGAADLDPYREFGAEALYLRSLLLEEKGRTDEALETLEELSGRAGDYMWIRLAQDRESDLSLLQEYSRELERAGEDDRPRLELLIAEKRLDLYGDDPEAIAGLREVAAEGSGVLRAMALSALVDNGAFPEDSVRTVLEYVLGIADSSDLATRIEDELGLPRGRACDSRPSALLEASWSLIDRGMYAEAWEGLDRILGTQWSYEREPQLLWAAYVASESARMDDDLVEGYLRRLEDEYPDTEEGAAAMERLGNMVEGGGGGDE
jgi:tetratricopeptide (TPR) repeat protein